MSPCETETNESLKAMQRALQRMLKSLVFRDPPPTPFTELPISQLRCLHAISEPEGQKMLEIAHRLEIKLPAMSQIVDRLVRRGMVERRPDPSDRRVVRLALTPMAQSILSTEHTAREARLVATVNNLAPDSLRRVIEGLSLLAEAAERVEAGEQQTTAPLSPAADPMGERMSRRTPRRKQDAALSPSDRNRSQ